MSDEKLFPDEFDKVYSSDEDTTEDRKEPIVEDETEPIQEENTTEELIQTETEETGSKEARFEKDTEPQKETASDAEWEGTRFEKEIDTDRPRHYDNRHREERYRQRDDYRPHYEERYEHQTPPTHSHYWSKIVAGGLVFGLVAGLVFTGVNGIGKNVQKANNIQTTNAPSNKGVSKTPNDVSSVVNATMPSVVSITCKMQSSISIFGQSQEEEGAGSGFIVSKTNDKLMIATNAHVVSGAQSITIGFNDGKTAKGTLVGEDQDADLAVVSVNLKDIPEETSKKIKIAVMGDSDKIKVGQTVIAIGNALGSGQSVTSGIVSVKNREVSFGTSTMQMIQTDAAINPGNSGGVLIDTSGNVIGINNSKVEDTSVEGMGYAIPINEAKSIITDVMNNGTLSDAEKGYLGITGRTITSDFSNAFNLPLGVYITQISEKSPAIKAGLKVGDVITKVNGSTVSSIGGLQSKISNKKAGTKIKLTYKRADQNGNYKEHTVTVTTVKKSQLPSSFGKESSNNQNRQNEQNQNNQGNQGNNGNQGNQNNQDQNPYYYSFGDDSDLDQDPFSYFFNN